MPSTSSTIFRGELPLNLTLPDLDQIALMVSDLAAAPSLSLVSGGIPNLPAWLVGTVNPSMQLAGHMLRWSFSWEKNQRQNPQCV